MKNIKLPKRILKEFDLAGRKTVLTEKLEKIAGGLAGRWNKGDKRDIIYKHNTVTTHFFKNKNDKKLIHRGMRINKKCNISKNLIFYIIEIKDGYLQEILNYLKENELKRIDVV